MGNIMLPYTAKGQYLEKLIKEKEEKNIQEKSLYENPIYEKIIPGASKRCIELIDSYYETRKYYPQKLDSLTRPLVIKFNNEKDEDVECLCTFIRRTTNDHLISKQKTNKIHEVEFDHCSYYHGDYWGGCLPKWVEDSES